MAERLSLTYHSVLTADRLADKFLQRQALHDAGLPGPAVWEAPTPGAGRQEDARAIEALADQVTYPVVVKPRRGTSSVATARADDGRQLSELLDEVRRAGGRPSRRGVPGRSGQHGRLRRRHRGRAVGPGRVGSGIWPPRGSSRTRRPSAAGDASCRATSTPTTEAELFAVAEAGAAGALASRMASPTST